MRRLLLAVFATCTISVFAQSLFAQGAPPPGTPGGGPRPASFKNLKILKPEEVRAAMGSFVAGTGMKCADCHVQGAFDSDEKPQKVTARKMLEMVRGVNAGTFNGDNKVTCYTCHRGEAHPVSAPPAK
jgi:hypothetical protein